MTLDTSTLFSRLVAHASATGLFEQVLTHEPKSAPGNGLYAAFWTEGLAPVPGASGLAATTGRLVLSVRIMTPADQEPADDIDGRVLAAVDALWTAYSGDFELGGALWAVDLLGAFGDPLQMRAGYLGLGSTVFRVMTINLPLIINDAWGQTP
jgi:hypothetical protein